MDLLYIFEKDALTQLFQQAADFHDKIGEIFILGDITNSFIQM